MKLLKEIQNIVSEAEAERKFEINQLLRSLEEEAKNPKSSIGLNKDQVVGESRSEYDAARGLAMGAGQEYTPGGVAPGQGQSARSGASQKPIFLMGKQIPASAVRLSDDGTALVRSQGRTMKFNADDMGDKIVLR